MVTTDFNNQTSRYRLIMLTICVTSLEQSHINKFSNLIQLARKYDMVIISSILERDACDVIWNTAGNFGILRCAEID